MTEASEAFFQLTDWLTGQARPGEVISAWLRGEDSDFVRFSRRRVRQAGHVRERELTVTLSDGRRQVQATLDLAGAPEVDRPRLAAALGDARQTLAHLPDDPYLLLPAEVRSTVDAHPSDLPDPRQALEALFESCGDADLAGLWASGPVYAGFASSSGQRNWFERATFHLDWSLHLPDGQAVKAVHAGERWDPALLRQAAARAAGHLKRLRRPAVPLAPARYRAYLAPATLRELLAALPHDSFEIRSWRTRQTPWLRLVEGARHLHPALTLREDHRGGLGPRFTPAGFVLPDQVVLVRDGLAGEPLADPRGAKEHGVAVNAAGEAPAALAVDAGGLPEEEVLATLGSGLYLSNLWYGNLSDRADCRVTGMTRYACFRVEGGEIAEPLAPMRFDDSLYGLLGERLLALTRERTLLPDDRTYEGRSTASMRLPGAVVEGLRLVL